MTKVRVTLGDRTFIADEIKALGRGSMVKVSSDLYLSLIASPPSEDTGFNAYLMCKFTDALFYLDKYIKYELTLANGDYRESRFRKDEVFVFDTCITYLSPIDELVEGVYDA